MRKIIGWILGAVGVVVLGVFGWLYIKAKKEDDGFFDPDDK